MGKLFPSVHSHAVKALAGKLAATSDSSCTSLAPGLLVRELEDQEDLLRLTVLKDIAPFPSMPPADSCDLRL